MTPAVGRIVHYKTRGSADGKFPPTVFASIITEVCSLNCVHLVTFGPSGLRFEQHVLQGYGPGEWNWPEIVMNEPTSTPQWQDNRQNVPYFPQSVQPLLLQQNPQKDYPVQASPTYCGTATAGATAPGNQTSAY